jgi:ubiquinone/menaquinone biosynthesis C-methylase UbiE
MLILAPLAFYEPTKKWNIASASLDIIYSNMMLNEVKNITTPIQEAHRCLKRNGQFIFSVTHPAWDLFIYAQELAGKPSTKIKNLGNYFRRGFASFIMSGGDKSNPHLADAYKQEFAVEHFQRPLSDYVHALTRTGFEIKEIVEPPLTRALLKHAPRFSEYGHHPIGLIFWCKKKR